MNIDSGPDTGFIVQGLYRLLAMPRGTPCSMGWGEFIRGAVPGMASGGLHTPNHRWVTAAALTQAGVLFPDLQMMPSVVAYLDEGIDVDNEQVVLRSDGRGRPRRPSYELPLGRPVPTERWEETVKERDLPRLPPATSTLTLSEIPVRSPGTV